MDTFQNLMLATSFILHTITLRLFIKAMREL